MECIYLLARALQYVLVTVPELNHFNNLIFTLAHDPGRKSKECRNDPEKNIPTNKCYNTMSPTPAFHQLLVANRNFHVVNMLSLDICVQS